MRQLPPPPKRLGIALVSLLLLLGLLAGPASASTEDEDFAAATYRAVLEREPSAAELSSAAGTIDATGRASFVESLLDSDAWLGWFVDDLYQQAFSRDPEDEGREFWIEQLRNGSATVDVATFVFSSPEFRSRAGDTDEGEISELYSRVLGREAEPEGLAFWVTEMEENGRDSVGRRFYQSTENRVRRVQLQYDRLLCRAGEAEGTDYWSERLLATSDHQLTKFILDTAEFESNASSDECRGEAPDGPTVLREFDDYAKVVYLDEANGEIVLSAGPATIVDSASGETIRTIGAEGFTTDIRDVSSDGRYLLLMTTDPELHGLTDAGTDPRSDSKAVVIDRTDYSAEYVPLPLGTIFTAAMSDDAQVFAFSSSDDIDPDDEVETAGTANVYHWDWSTSELTPITQANYYRHSHPNDLSADGNVVLWGAARDPFVDPNSDDVGESDRLWTTTISSSTNTPVPFDFSGWGYNGVLNPEGTEVLGLESAGQFCDVFRFMISASEVTSLGEVQCTPTGHFGANGQTIAYTKATALDESFRVMSTTIAVSFEGAPEIETGVAGSVNSLRLGNQGHRLAMTGSILGTSGTELFIVEVP